MKKIRRSEERGTGDAGWLHSNFSFSFAEYYNPTNMGFGLLRVLNDDIIEPGQGFGTHPHKDMEIITLVLEGDLTHEDSAGHKANLKRHNVQVMSAGKGIFHSEYNGSEENQLKLLQIWIHTKEKGIEPRHDEKDYSKEIQSGKTTTIASGEKNNGLYIHQDVWLLVASVKKGEKIEYKQHKPENGTYIFIIEGKARLLDETLGRRDSIEITGEQNIMIAADEDSEILIIEVPLK